MKKPLTKSDLLKARKVLFAQKTSVSDPQANKDFSEALKVANDAIKFGVKHLSYLNRER